MKLSINCVKINVIQIFLLKMENNIIFLYVHCSIKFDFTDHELELRSRINLNYMVKMINIYEIIL